MAANVSGNSDSNLSESWNVVDPLDFNISEASDGESIEVIDEEPIILTEQDDEKCYNLTQQQQKDEEKYYQQQALTPYIIEDNKLNADYTESELDDSCTDENATNDSSDESSTGYTREIISDCIYKASHVVIVLAGILIAGIMSTFFLDKVGELALVVVTLKKEMGSYKDIIVTDVNVQEELKYQSMKPDNLFNLNDKLEQELVNIFIDNVETTSESDEAANFEYLHSSKSLESVLSRLTDDDEKEITSPTIKLLHNISKHLDVLNNRGVYNLNIKEFARSWREKLTIINKKMTETIKKMRLKIVKEIDKNLRITQKEFYKNMCNKENIKRSECYEKFVKPYEDFNESLSGVDEDFKVFDVKEVLSLDEIILKTSDKEELKNGDSTAVPVNNKINNNVNQQPCKKKSVEQKHKTKNNEQQKVNENKGKLSACEAKKNTKNTNEKAKPIRIVKPTLIKNSNKDSNNKKQSQGNNKRSQSEHKKRKRRDYEEKTYEKTKTTKLYDDHKDNGKDIESDLLQDQNTDATNSFSSFSGGKEEGDEATENSQASKYESEAIRQHDIRDNWTRQTATSSWFLRLGDHRSRLRYYRSRGDWLFDRARFRRRWNLT